MMIKTTTTNTTIATITPTLELLSSDCEADSVGELKEVIVCTPSVSLVVVVAISVVLVTVTAVVTLVLRLLVYTVNA